MKRILLSTLVILGLVGSVAAATRAAFSDTETSTGNTFAAGTLDLDVDGNNGTNTVKFTVTNMQAGNQVIRTYRLNNVGTINGYLDLENIVVASKENGCAEPEVEAGDTTCTNPGNGEGELQNVLSLSKLFWDTNCNGWVEAGETTIFDGKVGTIATNYDANKLVNAGATQCVTAQFNWWSTADDNKAMGDDLTLDINFELAQTTAQ
jgi:spore coat-associated protein N